MIRALQQLDAGRKAAEVAWEVRVSTYTVYVRKAKYGRMSVSEAQEAKHLRVENRQQKKLVVVEMKEDYASLLYAEECLRIAMQADNSDEEGTSCLKNPHPLPSSDSGTHLADEKLDEIED